MPAVDIDEGLVYAGAAEPGAALPPIEFVPIAREWTRMIIAGGLALLLALCVLSSFWYVKWGLGDSADRDSLLNLIFTPLIGLLSAVTGFYFGERKSSD